MNRSKLDALSLASLVLLAPLLLFPVGALPWVGVGLAVGLAGWRAWAQGGLRLRREDIPLIYLGGMAVVGVVISVERALSWPRAWALLFGLLVFTTLRSALDLPRQARWTAAGVALLGLGLAGISLAGTDWGNLRFVALPWLYDRLPTLIRGVPGSGVAQASDLFNPRWVGMTMATLAPACLPLIGWRKAGWVRVLGGLAFVALTVTLLLTQSVQGLLGWAAGVFIVLVFTSRWFWLLLPAAGLAAVVWIGQLDLAPVGTALLSLDHPAGIAVVLRLDIWSRAWAMLGDMPFTGAGLNTFQVLVHEFYPGYLIGPEPHAHNLFLQTALDLGLPGLAAFTWFLSGWGWRAVRAASKSPARLSLDGSDIARGARRGIGAAVTRGGALTTAASANDASPEGRGEERLLLVGALAGAAAYLAAGLIDAMMLGAKPGFVVWALLGIGAAVTRGNEPFTTVATGNDASPKGRGKKRWGDLVAWLALPALVGLAVLLFPGKAALNLGTVQALHLLHPFPAAQVEAQDAAAARDNLEQALVHDPDAAQAHLLLGRLASAAGDFERAQAHYTARVALDMQDPVQRYHWTEAVRQWLGLAEPVEPARELAKVYQAWNTRFPDRAEVYLLKSLLQQIYLDDVQGAQATLQAGIKANALPVGLLVEALK